MVVCSRNKNSTLPDSFGSPILARIYLKIRFAFTNALKLPLNSLMPNYLPKNAKKDFKIFACRKK